MKHNALSSVSRLLRFGVLAAACFALIGSVCWLTPAPARAADDDIDFVPPVNSAPAKRIGGASRTDKADSAYICVLAPSDKVGQTTREQPVLYWYLSGPKNEAIQFGLTPIDPKKPEKPYPPVLELTVKGPHQPGLHKLDLAHPGDEPAVKLKPGMQYKWVVEDVVRELNGSNNPAAAARLELVPAPEDVAKKVKDATPAQQAAAYAKAGIWFDAIDALNRAIEANKDNKEQDTKLHEVRRKLLKSQGLEEGDKGTIVDPVGAAARGEEHHH